MNIIVNADDYGLSKGVNLGILEGVKNGIVTSTTMMAGGWAFEHGIELYKKTKDLKVGVHLTLTWGKPVLKDLKTLVGEDGNFIHRAQGVFGNPENLDPDEIKRELMAQIDKIRGNGVEITHLDSHHHAHEAHIVAEIVAEIAKSMGIPVRPVAPSVEIIRNAGAKTPEHFSQDFYDKNISSEFLINLFDQYKDGTLEIMCHPAYVDQDLIDATAYSVMRAKELQVLCSKEVKGAILEKGINLINYSNI